jgi:hypothetical protein
MCSTKNFLAVEMVRLPTRFVAKLGTTIPANKSKEKGEINPKKTVTSGFSETQRDSWTKLVDLNSEESKENPVTGRLRRAALKYFPNNPLMLASRKAGYSAPNPKRNWSDRSEKLDFSKTAAAMPATVKTNTMTCLTNTSLPGD